MNGQLACTGDCSRASSFFDGTSMVTDVRVGLLACRNEKWLYVCVAGGHHCRGKRKQKKRNTNASRDVAVDMMLRSCLRARFGHHKETLNPSHLLILPVSPKVAAFEVFISFDAGSHLYI